jgi:hypothetical protein
MHPAIETEKLFVAVLGWRRSVFLALEPIFWILAQHHWVLELRRHQLASYNHWFFVRYALACQRQGSVCFVVHKKSGLAWIWLMMSPVR